MEERNQSTHGQEVLRALGEYEMSVLYVDLEKNSIQIVLIEQGYENSVLESDTEELPGYDEALEMYTERIVYPEDRECVKKSFSRDALKNQLKEKKSFMMRYRCNAKEGEGAPFWAEAHAVRRSLASRADSIVLWVRNAEEQVAEENRQMQKLEEALEEARRASMAKSNFLRRMSHDIRTPINGILGMTNIGKKNLHDMRAVERCLEKIEQASYYLMDLINEVLDMNKLESGVIQLENRPFDLEELMRESAAVVEAQAAEAGIEFQEEYLPTEHGKVLGSPVHLRQIFQNIMTNAVKYNKEHGTVKVTGRELMADDTYMVYEWKCEDTGIGMKKEFQEHVFEPFVQESDDARSTYLGTGLGLAIVKQLTEHMGGSVSFISEKGKGTVFTVVLRLEIDKTVHDGKEGQTCASISLQNLNVLLVEDNELNMEIAEYILKDEGMNVTKAWDGQQAVEKFRESAPGDYDMILMDIMMPVMDGLEATRQIRAMERPDAAVIPIVAMTASTFLEDIRKSKEAGMSEHISKPLDVEKFIQALKMLRYGGRQAL